MSKTLTIDCGGGGLKAGVVDDSDALVCRPIRIPTPYPFPPERFVRSLLDIDEQLAAECGAADRITVGMPGMIRHGVVVATPHYVTTAGPQTAVDPGLLAAWAGYDARAALGRAFGRPVLVLNDAEVHGSALVDGTGLELVLTLGTGLGSALFDDGVPAPHLELSHAPVRRKRTYDRYVGEIQRRELGNAKWSRRVLRMVDGLRPVFHWDRLFLGGGNSALIDPPALAELGDDVTIVPNTAGVTGGARAWKLMGQ
ncbi:ROK family protein [Dactylosporangium fulvum]|uniref:ROK family protein n=1 Tax=Dactylosporangium fulvum TaxID=53359 RepID=A0ABY5VQA8_9ACTN|nr:ROK family protein [Dactylosporangium fulvum]UWP79470.1 ROK family protein [Dactylosporangium fulvum]